MDTKHAIIWAKIDFSFSLPFDQSHLCDKPKSSPINSGMAVDVELFEQAYELFLFERNIWTTGSILSPTLFPAHFSALIAYQTALVTALASGIRLSTVSSVLSNIARIVLPLHVVEKELWTGGLWVLIEEPFYSFAIWVTEKVDLRQVRQISLFSLFLLLLL